MIKVSEHSKNPNAEQKAANGSAPEKSGEKAAADNSKPAAAGEETDKSATTPKG